MHMAINIDDLQMETQQPAPADSGGVCSGGGPKPKRDLKSEMEALHERELRLWAD